MGSRLPWPGDAVGVAVDVVGDPVLADQVFGLAPAAGHLRGAEFPQRVEELSPVGTATPRCGRLPRRNRSDGPYPNRRSALGATWCSGSSSVRLSDIRVRGEERTEAAGGESKRQCRLLSSYSTTLAGTRPTSSHSLIRGRGHGTASGSGRRRSRVSGNSGSGSSGGTLTGPGVWPNAKIGQYAGSPRRAS